MANNGRDVVTHVGDVALLLAYQRDAALRALQASEVREEQHLNVIREQRKKIAALDATLDKANVAAEEAAADAEHEAGLEEIDNRRRKREQEREEATARILAVYNELRAQAHGFEEPSNVTDAAQ